MTHLSVLLPKLNQKKITMGLDSEPRFWRGPQEFKLGLLQKKMIKLRVQ